MPDAARFKLAFGLVTFVLFYEVFQHGGGRAVDLGIASFVLGLTAILCARNYAQLPRRYRLSGLLALLFPCYLLIQLIPLPIGLVRIISSARAEIADGLAAIVAPQHFVPLSVAPSATGAYFPRILIYVLTFLLAARLARHFAERPWVPVIPLIGIGGIQAAIGLFQYSKESASISGSYVNKDHFAGLMEMVLPFAVLGGISLLDHRNEQGRTPSSIALKGGGVFLIALAVLAAIQFSLSKMAFLSTLASLFIMGALWLGTRLSGWKRWFTLAGFGLTLLLVFLLLAPFPLIEGFGSLSSDPTAEMRLPIWKDTLHLAYDYPLFGCGGGNYASSFLRYQTAGLHYSWSEAHNDYLQSLSELGIFGFLIPAALMAYVMARAVRVAFAGEERQVRLVALACVGSLAAILIHSFADFNLDVPANAMVMAWTSGISVSLPMYGNRQKQSESARMPGLPIAVCILGWLAVLQGGAWVIFLQWFNSDPAAERAFCRVGICDSDSMLTIQELLHGRSPDKVPASELLELLRRDPAAPSRWGDLAASLRKAGHTSEARSCSSRAIALGPHIPYTLFRAANFHFELGENTAGLKLMACTLESDPDYAQDVLRRYDENRVPAEEILRYGLPDRSAYQAFCRLLMEEKRTIDVAKAWDWGISRGYVDNPAANEYIEFLIRQGRPEDAAQAWTLYAGSRSKEYPGQNRIFNGDFESDPSGSRFDWTIAPPSGVTVSFDHDIKRSGKRCLRIQFEGTQNVVDTGIRETVFLKPGRYRFRAYIRTENISTDQGVSFRLVDEESPNRLSFTTEALRESHDWTLVEHVFDAPAGVGLVNVGLVRRPSFRFDCMITGTMWVDQVAITRE